MYIKDIPVDRAREVFAYDANTGVISYRIRRGTRGPGDRAGTIVNGRRRMCLDYSLYHSNRMAWVLHHGAQPVGVIDHVDGDPLNDAADNLRDVTQQQNTWNARQIDGTVSGHKGVQWHVRCQKWHARTTVNGRTVYFGLHESLADAIAAYEAGVTKLRGEYHRVTR